MKKRKDKLLNRELNLKGLIFRCFIHSLLFFIIGILICLVISYFAFKTNDPTSLFKICSTCTLFISVMVTGFILAKVNKQHYLLGGIILGTFILVFTILITLSIPNESITKDAYFIKLLIPAFSVLGSMIGIQKQNKKSKHHR